MSDTGHAAVAFVYQFITDAEEPLGGKRTNLVDCRPCAGKTRAERIPLRRFGSKGANVYFSFACDLKQGLNGGFHCGKAVIAGVTVQPTESLRAARIEADELRDVAAFSEPI